MREITKVVKAYEDGINQNRIIGSICVECHELAVPPRPICRKCGSNKVDFTSVEPTGKLVTWTIIHIAPPTHLDKVPYILGIVELDENKQRLTGIVDLPENMSPEFDMKLIADYEEGIEGANRLRWRIPI